jgi:hypothetical protein
VPPTSRLSSSSHPPALQTTNEPVNQPPPGGRKEQACDNPNGGGSLGLVWPHAWAITNISGRGLVPRRRSRSPQPAVLLIEPSRSPFARAVAHRWLRSLLPLPAASTAAHRLSHAPPPLHAGMRKPSTIRENSTESTSPIIYNIYYTFK